MTWPDPGRVAITSHVTGYPTEAPFHPGEEYPEAPSGGATSRAPNPVYAAVRNTLELLGLDAENRGTAEWNPLRQVVSPGDLVVIKPNLVRHWNGAEDHITALVTHGSMVRAVADYVLLALRGRGTLVVGDAPVQETDFAATVDQSGVKDAMEWIGNHAGDVDVSLVDWRKERAHCDRAGNILRHEALPGDPRGFVEVDLGRESFLGSLADSAGRFRVTNYDEGGMAHAHTSERNSYLVSGTILQADAVITLPKMKCHGKAGITCALKNNVGINGHKDWLPHHRIGSREEGGDEYEHRSVRKRMLTSLATRADRSASLLVKKFFYYTGQAIMRTRHVVPCKDTHREGSWHGNDTVWRMCLDLNRILHFVDREGRLTDRHQRRFLGLVDGVVAGEGNGPLHPTSKPAGVILGGFNPAAIDLACCHLMGFDHAKIPLLRGALDQDTVPLLFPGSRDTISVASDHEPYTRLFELARAETLAFTPHRGWVDHVELA